MAKRSDEIDLVYTIRGRDDGSLRRVTQRAQADVTAAQRQAERAAMRLGGDRGGTLSASRGGLQMERDQLAAELRQQRRFQQTARAANQSAAVARTTPGAALSRAAGGGFSTYRPALGQAAMLAGVRGGGGVASAIFAAEAVAGEINRARDGSGSDGSTARDRFVEGLRGWSPLPEFGRRYNEWMPEWSPIRQGQNLISRVTGGQTIAEAAQTRAFLANAEARIAARQERIEATRNRPAEDAAREERNRVLREESAARDFDNRTIRAEREAEARRAARSDAVARTEFANTARRNLQDAIDQRASVSRSAAEALLIARAGESSTKLGAAAAAASQYRQLIDQGVDTSVAQQLAVAGYGDATRRGGVAPLATASSLGAGNVGARSSGLGGGDTTVKRDMEESRRELKEQTRILKEIAAKIGTPASVIESLGVGF
jgi:hypothetical protein